MLSGLEIFFFHDASLSFHLCFYKLYNNSYPDPSYYFFFQAKVGPEFFFSKNLPHIPTPYPHKYQMVAP